MGELAKRRAQTSARLNALRRRLKRSAILAKDKACVYATGSFGRCEASRHSDLDLFIVGKTGPDKRSQLKRLDDICIKAELISATQALKIPPFSGDGQYLGHYSVNDLTQTLGKPDDDATNTFTARLLLLLESVPLVEASVYEQVTKEVIAAYWRDYADHKSEFTPAYLANDILRLWRTFCVNYEAGTERVPEEKKAKGKLKNYKLKHSRLLTCYSALLYLLAVFSRKGSVSPTDAMKMIRLTPTQRLEWLRDQPDLAHARSGVVDLLDRYEYFLETTDAPEEALLRRFSNRKISQQHMEKAYEFGDCMFGVLTRIGNENRFHRLLVV